MEHTKGKWKAVTHDDGYLPHYIATSKSVIATLEYNRDGSNTEEVIANAQLIAAAPALLEACEEAVEHGREAGCQPSDKVIAAIKAAKGG